MRATKDVYIVISADVANARRLAQLLSELGAVRPDGSPIPNLDQLRIAHGELPEPLVDPSQYQLD